MKIKSLLIIILLINYFSSDSQNIKNNQDNIQGYLSYSTYDKINIKELYGSIVQIEMLMKGEQDSSRIKEVYNLSQKEIKNKLSESLKSLSESQKKSPLYKVYKEAINNLNSFKIDGENLIEAKETIDYYFFKDTVRVNEPILVGDRVLKTVFIPKDFKKYREAIYNGKPHRDILNYKKRFKRWNTSYTIKVNKRDTKRILNFIGYKVIIDEKRKSEAFSDTYYHNVYELYVSDSYQYPFNYYSFLQLSKLLDIKGLILECKTYEADNPESFSLLRLSKFNSNKQDRSLIEIDFKQYKKEEF